MRCVKDVGSVRGVGGVEEGGERCEARSWYHDCDGREPVVGTHPLPGAEAMMMAVLAVMWRRTVAADSR